MKIAILNECFLHEEHLERLKILGEVVIFNNTKTKDKAVEGFVQGVPKNLVN